MDNKEWSNKIEDYHLLETIGSGRFGRVVRGYYPKNCQECALKIVSMEQMYINTFYGSRKSNEISIHKSLNNHQNITKLFSVIRNYEQDTIYLVMELCRGESLAKLLYTKARGLKWNWKGTLLPEEVISSIILQMCNALEYLHNNSIVHRDVSVNNILLTKPFDPHEKIEIKLTDFGLAKILENQTDLDDLNSTICGTPGFISPEIWNQKKKLSYKSDIFSLGSVVFACVTGYTPEGPISLDGMSPMIANLIKQLLEHKPEKRPELDQIRQHIFVTGRINTKRLFPIEKTTNNLYMSISKSGDATMRFGKNLSMIVSKDGSSVRIVNYENLINFSNTYQFWELPEKYWKHFCLVARFVNLVKSKTGKIIINCCGWLKEDHLRNEYITKCILMNNGDFEFTIHDVTHNLDKRYLLNGSLDDSVKKYEANLIELHKKVLNLDKEFEKMEHLGLNFFPVTLNHDLGLLKNCDNSLNLSLNEFENVQNNEMFSLFDVRKIVKK